MAEPFATSIEGDIVAGPLRRPRNAAKNEKGSIHEDTTALKLGFRGGTVAGSLHMEQFPPLLEHLFGEQWWDTGGLSLYFRYATTDREGVQAFGIVPHSNRTEVWMDDQRGTRIADGTANVRGLDPESALRHRIEAVPAATDLRILDGLTAGTRARDFEACIDNQLLDERLAVITEPSSAYSKESAWGRPVLPPSLMVRAMRALEPGLLDHASPAIGLFGAIEVQHINGPVFADTTYRVRGSVLAASDTPKTEYLWYESTLYNDGGDVASMLMMLRFMKASSPLWSEELADS